MSPHFRIAVTPFSATTLLLLAICAMWVTPARAQSQSGQQDIQQLKDKLGQLEQAMDALKAQINALQTTTPPAQGTAQPQKTSEPPEGTPVPMQGGMPQRPSSDEVPIEGEITEKQNTVSLYGFAMLDGGYNFGQIDPLWYDVVRPTKLPSYANQFAPSGTVYASVRQTRFGVKSSTPTQLGDLNTVFEFELYGTGVDAGQTTLRLRHAYGELGAIGAGQTWSPFMDIGVFPNTVEYWGPTGMAFFRNVQVRWMPVRKKSGSVTIALERPGASGDGGVYAGRIELSNITPRFNFPDLSGNGRIERKWGYLQTAAIVRKIGWVNTSTTAPTPGASVVGWGINLTSNLNLSKNDVAKLAFVYGRGIQNYMNDAPFDVGLQHNPAGSAVPFKAVPLPLYGMVAFLDHSWSKRFTSSAGYSMIDIVNSTAENASDFHKGDYALANLLYHPVPKVMMGSEFQFGRRTNYLDGFSFNDYRVQFTFKFDWDKSFKSPSF